MHLRPSKPKPNHNFSFEAIGTLWNIEFFDRISSVKAKNILNLINKRIEEFDKNYSRFRGDSLVTRISKKAGKYQLPSDAKPMLDLYFDLYRLSSGAVTPLIGQTLVEAGYDVDYSLVSKQLSTLPTWKEAIVYDFSVLNVKLPVLLDFGAAGKGYLVDIVSQIIRNGGVKDFCVDAGGDIYYQNQDKSKTINIGLENPSNDTEVIGVAAIINQSLCGSAGNRRKWGKYHHIIDPRSLTSPTNISAVWVIADTGLIADGLTTALFFVPAKILVKHYNFEYAIVYSDGGLEKSNNFPATFFTS